MKNPLNNEQPNYFLVSISVIFTVLYVVIAAMLVYQMRQINLLELEKWSYEEQAENISSMIFLLHFPVISTLFVLFNEKTKPLAISLITTAVLVALLTISIIIG